MAEIAPSADHDHRDLNPDPAEGSSLSQVARLDCQAEAPTAIASGVTAGGDAIITGGSTPVAESVLPQLGTDSIVDAAGPAGASLRWATSGVPDMEGVLAGLAPDDGLRRLLVPYAHSDCSAGPSGASVVGLGDAHCSVWRRIASRSLGSVLDRQAIKAEVPAELAFGSAGRADVSARCGLTGHAGDGPTVAAGMPSTSRVSGAPPSSTRFREVGAQPPSVFQGVARPETRTEGSNDCAAEAETALDSSASGSFSGCAGLDEMADSEDDMALRSDLGLDLVTDLGVPAANTGREVDQTG